MSIASNLAELGALMKRNLETKGVSGLNANMGLTTLANKILDIPSTGGDIEIDTTISCSVSSNNVFVGDSITVSGVLRAVYDGDVDLAGVLSGASIKIYNGQTLLGTVITDSDGEYTFNFTTVSSGTLGIVAVFDGASFCDDCQSSSVSVAVAEHDYSFSNMSVSPTTILEGGSVTISGILKEEGYAFNHGTVTIYDGSTSIGTCTSNVQGVFRKTFDDLSAGSHSLKACYNGFCSSATTVTVTSLIETSLIFFSASQSIHVGQAATLYGVLSDSSDSPIASASVKIYQGNSLVSTVTTDSNGEFEYVSSTISSPGSLTYKAVYEGDSTYKNSESSNVTVTVLEYTYSLTANASSTSISEGQSITISGVLKRDNSAYAGQTIKLKGITLAVSDPTTTTGSDGSYSFTVSNLLNAYSPYTLYTTWNDDIESEDITVTVSQPVVPDSLVVTGTKSILSYADSESSVLTATVKDANDTPLSGQTVVFKKGSTTLDTKTTDSNGQCTYTYSSSGAGDVTLTVECSLLQETYVLEDCNYYNAGSVTSDTTVSIALPSDFEISFTSRREYSSSNVSYLEIGGDSGNTALCGQIGSSGESQVRIYDNEGSSQFTPHPTSNNPINTDTFYKWTHNGTDNTFSMNSSTVTWTDSKTHSKIRTLKVTRNKMQRLKVKAL